MSNFPVTCHTRHVGPGSTFVAIDGFVSSGVSFIEQAIARGAKKIVVSNKSREGAAFGKQAKSLSALYPGVEFCFVSDCRKALAELSARELGYPASKLKIIGITGTKGKTTTAFLVEHLLSKLGFKTALLGSIYNKLGKDVIASERTTPESDYLHKFFCDCVEKQVTHVVMEVSSHSIALDRIHGLSFDVVGFTNLAAEHLDFHKTIDEYFATKCRLFSQVKPGGAIVINCDDPWGKKCYELLRERRVQIVPVTKSSFVLESDALFGEFNAYNLAMAHAICKQVCMIAGKNVTTEQFLKSLEGFAGVPGRLQLHTLANGARAFVDYAHNPSSMRAVLQALRPLTKHLIVLFGCGGDRDKTKRPVMANLAATYGDFVIITDDNPRNEDPEKIIESIYAGIPKEKQKITLCIKDRAQAIAKAVALSNSDSVIALLGKGHESYYLCKGEKKYWSDCVEIEKY